MSVDTMQPAEVERWLLGLGSLLPSDTVRALIAEVRRQRLDGARFDLLVCSKAYPSLGGQVRPAHMAALRRCWQQTKAIRQEPPIASKPDDQPFRRKTMMARADSRKAFVPPTRSTVTGYIASDGGSANVVKGGRGAIDSEAATPERHTVTPAATPSQQMRDYRASTPALQSRPASQTPSHRPQPAASQQQHFMQQQRQLQELQQQQRLLQQQKQQQKPKQAQQEHVVSRMQSSPAELQTKQPAPEKPRESRRRSASEVDPPLLPPRARPRPRPPQVPPLDLSFLPQNKGMARRDTSDVDVRRPAPQPLQQNYVQGGQPRPQQPQACHASSAPAGAPTSGAASRAPSAAAPSRAPSSAAMSELPLGFNEASVDDQKRIAAFYGYHSDGFVATMHGLKTDEIRPRLFLGTMADAAYWPMLKALGVTHVLNCAVEAQKTKAPYESHGIKYLMLSLTDSAEQAQQLCKQRFRALREATKFIHSAIKARSQRSVVFVHCVQGLSRSAAIVCAYLMEYEGLSMDRALSEVRIRHKGCLSSHHWQGFLYKFNTELLSNS